MIVPPLQGFVEIGLDDAWEELSLASAHSRCFINLSFRCDLWRTFCLPVLYTVLGRKTTRSAKIVKEKTVWNLGKSNPTWHMSKGRWALRGVSGAEFGRKGA